MTGLPGVLSVGWWCVQASTAEARNGVDADDQGLSQPWYKSRKMLLVLGAYGSIAFLMNFLEELSPLFASAPCDKVDCRPLLQPV